MHTPRVVLYKQDTFA